MLIFGMTVDKYPRSRWRLIIIKSIFTLLLRDLYQPYLRVLLDRRTAENWAYVYGFHWNFLPSLHHPRLLIIPPDKRKTIVFRIANMYVSTTPLLKLAGRFPYHSAQLAARHIIMDELQIGSSMRGGE